MTKEEVFIRVGLACSFADYAFMLGKWMYIHIRYKRYQSKQESLEVLASLIIYNALLLLIVYRAFNGK